MSSRDKRAIILTVLVCGSILFNHYVLTPWFSHWEEIIEEKDQLSKKMKKVNLGSSSVKAKIAALNKKMPHFKLPENEHAQRHLMHKKVSEQLKKLRIKADRIGFIGSSKKDGPYRKLNLQSQFICPLAQLFDLLAVLEDNPYLGSLEDMNIRVDPKERGKVWVTLTLSTYCL
ncbi:MAG: hypothetical protein HQL32_15200 [Planctomycetes bacterium]|nr:hypothetical protein [Planctomycetota bacterium]